MIRVAEYGWVFTLEAVSPAGYQLDVINESTEAVLFSYSVSEEEESSEEMLRQFALNWIEQKGSPYRIPGRCHACDAVLEGVFEGTAVHNQYREALEITFSGGYGEFVDLTGVSYPVVICESCANALCDTVPWIRTLLREPPDLDHDSLARCTLGQLPALASELGIRTWGLTREQLIEALVEWQRE